MVASIEYATGKILITMDALLPISINGIGLREGTLAAVGGAFGLGSRR